MSITEITFAQGPLAAEVPAGTPGGVLNEIIFDAVAWDGERPVTGGAASITMVSSNYPETLIKKGKANELTSKLNP